MAFLSGLEKLLGNASNNIRHPMNIVDNLGLQRFNPIQIQHPSLPTPKGPVLDSGVPLSAPSHPFFKFQIPPALQRPAVPIAPAMPMPTTDAPDNFTVAPNLPMPRWRYDQQAPQPWNGRLFRIPAGLPNQSLAEPLANPRQQI